MGPIAIAGRIFQPKKSPDSSQFLCQELSPKPILLQVAVNSKGDQNA